MTFTVTVTDSLAVTADRQFGLSVCRRAAWLALDGRTLPLEDAAAGYYCTDLDLLGYPSVRDVTSNRPDQDGLDDQSAYWAGRAVSADLEVRGGLMTVDEIAALFGPWMLPGLRPELHYVLDRPGLPERVLTVRAADYAVKISGRRTRQIHLAWVAPDPVAWAPTTSSVSVPATAPGLAAIWDDAIVAWNAAQIDGRGSALPFSGPPAITNTGDVAVRPVFRIYGPITAAAVVGVTSAGQLWRIVLTPTPAIPNGQWLEVDTRNRTVITGPTVAVALHRLDWLATVWPALPAGATSTMIVEGTGITANSRVVASWRNGFLL